MIHRLADASERVLPERGIVKMHREVLQHQVQGGRGVLQVMDEECRHGLKCLKFLRLEEGAGELGG
jgi:hypothetical protein